MKNTKTDGKDGLKQTKLAFNKNRKLHFRINFVELIGKKRNSPDDERDEGKEELSVKKEEIISEQQNH